MLRRMAQILQRTSVSQKAFAAMAEAVWTAKRNGRGLGGQDLTEISPCKNCGLTFKDH